MWPMRINMDGWMDDFRAYEVCTVVRIFAGVLLQKGDEPELSRYIHMHQDIFEMCGYLEYVLL